MPMSKQTNHYTLDECARIAQEVLGNRGTVKVVTGAPAVRTAKRLLERRLEQLKKDSK